MTAITTYPKEGQRRYFVKQYFLIDPTLCHSATLLANFDWQDIERENQALRLQHSPRKLQICLEHNEIRFWTSTVRLRAGAQPNRRLPSPIRSATELRIGGSVGEPRAPDISACAAARGAPPDVIPLALDRVSGRPLAHRSAFRRRNAARFSCARFRRRRRLGDRSRA
ncbi:MAG: autoinducer binding domain-containing protein [Hyphomicrobiales bacterium]|nr:autoinducer binding domain-containing protein [Hyphomicrobiales bacterium]